MLFVSLHKMYNIGNKQELQLDEWDFRKAREAVNVTESILFQGPQSKSGQYRCRKSLPCI